MFYLMLVMYKINLLINLRQLNLLDDKMVRDKGIVDIVMPLFVILYLLLSMIFTTGLFIYHTSLIYRNLTTKEELKGAYKNIFGNPFNEGFLRNFRKILCPKLPFPCMLEKIRMKIFKKYLKVLFLFKIILQILENNKPTSSNFDNNQKNKLPENNVQTNDKIKNIDKNGDIKDLTLEENDKPQIIQGEDEKKYEKNTIADKINMV